MTAFFGVGGNPFATPVGQRIEQATDASLASENWGLNMEICDIINETEDGPKDAVKALRKRLQQNAGKNYIVVMYTLTVLETCVKNCGRRFHVLVCNKEFVQELVKLIAPSPPLSWLQNLPPSLQNLSAFSLSSQYSPIGNGGGPKNDPPTAVQEKVLSLIQSWADAFNTQPEMSGVVQIYQDLKSKGIEFPMTDLDAMAPIHTPQRVSGIQAYHDLIQRSIPDGEVAVGVSALAAQQAGTLGATKTPTSPRLTPDQLGKLHGELDVVQGNMAVMSEMLSELTPGQEHPSDIQLLKELHETLKTMQARLVELISKLANEEITEELLRINDLLNNIFLRYSRFENNREMAARAREGVGAAMGGAAMGGAAMGGASLIDLSDETTSQLSGLSLKAASSSSAHSAAAAARPDKDDEFDMFAQSRNVTYETSKNGGSSTFEANLKPDQISGSLGAVAQTRSQPQTQANTDSIIGMHKESDFDEMAAWLGDEASQESLTSSEFERFLAERAAAADNLPTPPSHSPSSPSHATRHRRGNKEPEDASLYAL
ncbi:target of Myb1 membrane trafficking protein-like isoform X2 [Macrosteles quadrilineatus]|uniref:target of Myb1 membrane trafficking protein-like isoform X2 n=1 Tax=Macrosteles quadrilineatus TaxID=74068 RepID=UPI0023E23DA9|nr:target of Myb1 membrane trafficking protein-like isoform X2 [Macrosteles quadrilineatus]